MRAHLFWILIIFGAFIMSLSPVQAQAKTEKAIFAGGCFWCMHAEFEQLKGVNHVLSGYTGGTVPNPTYEQVSTGETGHVEVIEVTFDPTILSYEDLLSHFWENVDPTDPRGQFCDKGNQYLAGIFYTSPAQRTQAEHSITQIEKRLGSQVATFLRPAVPFYKAEDDHQSFYKKNALRYELYKKGCGRDQKLEKIWNKS
jgi:peptide-methionine (S)-S-oxide reductase